MSPWQAIGLLLRKLSTTIELSERVKEREEEREQRRNTSIRSSLANRVYDLYIYVFAYVRTDRKERSATSITSSSYLWCVITQIERKRTRSIRFDQINQTNVLSLWIYYVKIVKVAFVSDNLSFERYFLQKMQVWYRLLLQWHKHSLSTRIFFSIQNHHFASDTVYSFRVKVDWNGSQKSKQLINPFRSDMI